jgi:hypothetical protein
MKAILILALIPFLTGCIAGKSDGVRETTTSKLDSRGMITEQTVTTESIGTSKYSEYSRTVPEVVRAISDADIARTQAIVEDRHRAKAQTLHHTREPWPCLP